MKTSLNILLLTLFLLASSNEKSEGQKHLDGLTFHGDFFNIVIPSGFTGKSKQRVGNFDLGADYQFFKYDKLDLFAGINFLWLEMNGSMKLPDESLTRQLQFELFAPSIYLGSNYSFHEKLGAFLDIGFSMGAKYNQLGTYKGWVLSGKSISIIPLNFGIKYSITPAIDINMAIATNLGDNITEFGNPTENFRQTYENADINFTTIDFGISYNLFQNTVSESVIHKKQDRIKSLIEDKKSLKIKNSKLDSIKDSLQNEIIYQASRKKILNIINDIPIGYEYDNLTYKEENKYKLKSIGKDFLRILNAKCKKNNISLNILIAEKYFESFNNADKDKFSNLNIVKDENTSKSSKPNFKIIGFDNKTEGE